MNEYITKSERETAAIARHLATTLRGGDVLLLSGNLGAGKTAFVRGLAEGLDANPDDVSSPTFILAQTYDGGRLPLHHVDLYRLESTPDLESVGVGFEAGQGIGEGGNGVLAIEWPERLASPAPDALRITIEILDDTTRRIRVERS